jgi:arabinose-5-phosphate isomerase
MDKPVDLDLARNVLRAEGQSILALAGQVGSTFTRAATALFNCTGQVVLTGVGKAGIISQKISATLASTGTRSIFLHPVEALHGDLGRVSRGDVVVACSHSGATEEILRLVDHLKGRGATLVAITGEGDSPLAKFADITITYGQVQEACPLGLAPTVSTSCMLALGDALALVVMQMREFTPEDFAAFHPAGALGRKLLRVEEAMTFRQGGRLCVVPDTLTLGDALIVAQKVERRTGAMMLVDAQGQLSGILTDADLRRALVRARQEGAGDGLMDKPVGAFMIRNPKHIHIGELASKALGIISQYRIDELPVLDDQSRPVGLVDVQDLVGIRTVANGKE